MWYDAKAMWRLAGILLILACAPLNARELWQAGQQYVRLEARETSSAGPNDHPVDLTTSDMAALLLALQARKVGRFFQFTNEEPVPLFTAQMVGLLAEKLVEGLEMVGPEEELTFVVVGFYRGKLLAGDRRSVGGRVFYRGDRLHFIFGDVLRSLHYGPERDIRGFETEVDRRIYPLYAGSRDKKGSKGWELLIGKGMVLHDERKDWVEIELPVVMNALQDLQTEEDKDGQIAGDDMPAKDVTALRAEMRRQRVELARMRKRIESPEASVEERLKTLESLRRKELVTEEEYKAKRKAILDSL